MTRTSGSDGGLLAETPGAYPLPGLRVLDTRLARA